MIDEAGLYVHSETRLSDKIDIVAALRVDDHNRIEDPNFSPRAALVLHPSETNTVRFTFNRAFATPTTNSLFLDRLAGTLPIIPGISYDLRVLGVPADGLSFPSCAGGFMNPACACRRRPV